MLPVMESNIIRLDFKQKAKNRNENNYMKLMAKQLYWLNRNAIKLFCRADIVYAGYITKTLNKHVFDRCCNFPLLEEKCKEYNNIFVEI